MPPTFEDDVEAYYQAKESYIDLLLESAAAEPVTTEKPKGDPIGSDNRIGHWFPSPRSHEYAAKARSRIDVAAIIATSTAPSGEPAPAQPNCQSKPKGKK